MEQRSIPFIATLRVSLSGGGTGSFQYQNSANRRFIIKTIIQKSDGEFNITDMSNNSADQFTNASGSNPLSGDVFPDMETDTDSPLELPIPLVLEGQEILKFDLVDISTSTNVVTFALIGSLEMG